MFCHKCGNQLPDDSVFCQKCGTKLIAKGPALQSQTHVTPISMVSSPVLTQTSTPAISRSGVNANKKSSKKTFIIAGAVVAAIVIAILIITNWNGKVNYIATVNMHQPFVSQGYSATYGAVFTKFIDSLEYSETKVDEDVHVAITGTLKGSGEKIAVSIRVTIDKKDSETAIIVPRAISLDGEQTRTQNDAVGFLLSMFEAYTFGFETYADYLVEWGDTSVEQPGPISLSQTFISEDDGISFRYPGAWKNMHEEDPNLLIALGADIDIPEAASSILVFRYHSTQDRIDKIFSSSISDFEDAFPSDAAIYDISDGLVDGVPARRLVYLVDYDGVEIAGVRYFIAADLILFRIDFECRPSQMESLEPFFTAIIESVRITIFNNELPDSTEPEEDDYGPGMDFFDALFLGEKIELLIYWDDGRRTLFEGEKIYGDWWWYMHGRDGGEVQEVYPTFDLDDRTMEIRFPTTERVYYLYDDFAGIFGTEAFSWSFASW